MYNALNYISRYEFDRERLHEIRRMESVKRDERARQLIKELEKEREEKGIPRTRPPVLVCRRMEHLPKPGVK